MKIPLACLLLLFTSVLSQATVNDRYKTFITQHINFKMSENRCDAEIDARKITQTDSNLCKETNTFIQTTTNYVKAICNKAGTPYGEMTKSLQPFPVVVCKLKNEGARRPHCQYRGRALTRRIVIRCEEGFPVHYAKDIVVLENDLPV